MPDGSGYPKKQPPRPNRHKKAGRSFRREMYQTILIIFGMYISSLFLIIAFFTVIGAVSFKEWAYYVIPGFWGLWLVLAYKEFTRVE